MLTCRTTLSPKHGKTEARERYWVSQWGVWDKKEKNGESKIEKKEDNSVTWTRDQRRDSAEQPGVWTLLLPVGHLPLHSPRLKLLNRDWEDWVMLWTGGKRESLPHT